MKRTLVYWEEIFNNNVSLSKDTIVQAWKTDAMPKVLPLCAKARVFVSERRIESPIVESTTQLSRVCIIWVHDTKDQAMFRILFDLECEAVEVCEVTFNKYPWVLYFPLCDVIVLALNSPKVLRFGLVRLCHVQRRF